ncbi:MAG TPA: ATP-binding protein, partial [Gammaproteobacteria bacterium]|nr:ATP-binding protein [Gammaproteobacteria bacterium]
QRRDHEWICPTQDNGIGINPEFHERIFDIFQRPHSPQVWPGTAIGLAICRRRVAHRHGG